MTVVAMRKQLSDGASRRMTEAACGVALIIPTLNEAASIGAVVRSIPRDVVGRIIVADGGSSDDTGECAQRSGAEVLDVGRGYGRACLLATQAATDADIVVFMDGDGADDVQAIRSLVDPIWSGLADFVIGSRVRGEREPGSMSWHQVAAGVLGGFGMKLLYGVRYTDMCAFRAIRRDALLGLGMSEMTYGWNIRDRDALIPQGDRTASARAACQGGLLPTSFLHCASQSVACFREISGSTVSPLCR